MKICWDNLEGFYLTKFGNLKKYNGVVWETCICIECGEEFLGQKGKNQRFCDRKCSKIGKNNPFHDKKHTEEVMAIMIKRGPKSGKWTGGYYKRKIPKYDAFANKISYAEPVRRNQEDPNILEIKCTWCGKWFIPKVYEVQNRIRALNGYKYTKGELRFYCSDGCKQNCPIWGKTSETLIKQDAINARRLPWLELNREVQHELRKMVFQRDGYQCVKCGSDESLHCHHVEGIRWAPLESADVNACITVCSKCHKEIHKKDGCTYNDMKCLLNEKMEAGII